MLRNNRNNNFIKKKYLKNFLLRSFLRIIRRRVNGSEDEKKSGNKVHINERKR